MLGINSRSTRDMDISIKGIDVSQENMVQVLNEILSLDIQDGVKFEMVNVTDIRADDEYFFLTKLKNDINLEIFKQTLNNTLKKRDSLDYYKDYRKILDGLINDERINNYWSTYKKKTKYAKNIEFRKIIGVLEEFLDNI